MDANSIRVLSKKLKVRNGCKLEAECFSVKTFCVLCQRRITIFRTFCKRIFPIITFSLPLHSLYPLPSPSLSFPKFSVFCIQVNDSPISLSMNKKCIAAELQPYMVGISLGAKFFVTQGPDVYHVKSTAGEIF